MSRYIICSLSPRFNDFFCNDVKDEFKKEKIAIVGYGWAGRSFYKHINKDKFDVDIYDKNNYFLDTTKLKYINSSVKLQHFNDKIIKSNIDLTKINDMKIGDINYDKIILATGSEINDYNIPGVKQYCHFLKTLDDYNNLKESLQKLDSKDEIMIIGGGATGVELASHLSNKFSNISIIEANDILPDFNNITRKYVKDNHKDINFIINSPVKKIVKNSNHFDIYSDKNKYSAKLIIYCAGVKTNNIKTNEHIYKIGDLSPGEKTAQKARKEGEYYAKCIEKNNCSEFNYNSEGKLLYIKNEIIYDKNKITYIYSKRFQFIFDWLIDDSFEHKLDIKDFHNYPKGY